MTNIALERLYNQHIAAPWLKTPAGIVSYLGAVQAQEVWGGKWSIGLRLPDSVEADIDAAVADKSIVRAFFMRGTLHYLPGADIRWMTPLIADRVRRLLDSTSRYNKTGLDETIFRKAQDVLAQTMAGRQLTRDEVKAALAGAGIQTTNMGYMFLIQRAQIDGLLCYGLDRGKQQTWTLLDEWLPSAPVLNREAALAEFARRFFVSRGPATVHDFANWSGMSMADAKAGLEAVRRDLNSETIGGSAYYFAPPSAKRPPLDSPDAHLLPTYDEYFIGYKDRSASISAEYGARWAARTDHNVSPLLIDGLSVGVWWRMLKKNTITFNMEPFGALSDAATAALRAAALRYATFLGLEAVFA